MNALVVLLAASLGTGLLWVSWMRRWLTASGVIAAAVVGAALAAGLGWRGLAILAFFFVSSSILTRHHTRARARARGRGRVGRTAGQVFANGGIAALAALAGAAGAWSTGAAALAAAGALAAATADTWASEVGEWTARDTRLVTTWRRVPPGTDGGVSWPGTLAGSGGALSAAVLGALLFAEPAWLVPVVAAGVTGMGVDSVLGATLEAPRGRLASDAVNWVGTCSGALLALAIG